MATADNITPMVLIEEVINLEYKENTIATNQRVKVLGKTPFALTSAGTIYCSDTLKQILQRATTTRIYQCYMKNHATCPSEPLLKSTMGTGWSCTEMNLRRDYGVPLSEVYTERWEYTSDWTVYKQEVIKADITELEKEMLQEQQKWALPAFSTGSCKPDPSVWIR